jgi:hypothetical protein
MTGIRFRNLRTAPAALCAALLLTAAACDGFLDTERESRETIRVLVSGTSPVPLLLVTSDQFASVQDPATGQILLQVIASDTLTITQLPVDTTYAIGQFNRILVRLVNPDPAATADVRMIIRLDDEEEAYNVQARITGAYLEYSYMGF